MVHFSKTVCGIFHFQFRFVFIKLYIFIRQKAWTLSLTLKRHNSSQNKNERKTTQSFTLRPLIFKLQQEVWKFNDISWVLELPKNWSWEKLFKLQKSKFWQRHSIVTFKKIFDISLLFLLYFFNWIKQHLLKTSIYKTQV